MKKTLFTLFLITTFYNHGSGMSGGFGPLVIEYKPEAEQNNCSEVDLRPELKRRNLPDRRDQDTTGWCYAFVVADLLSFKYGVNVSPSDIARQTINGEKWRNYYYPDTNRISSSDTEETTSIDNKKASPAKQNTPLGGGHINLTLDIMNKEGIVLDEDCPSEDVVITDIEYNSQQSKKHLTSSQASIGTCFSKEQFQSLFPADQLQQVYDIISNDEFKRVLTRMAQGRCNIRQHVGDEITYKKRWHGDEGTSRDDVIDLVDEALTKEKIVGVSYDKGLLVKPTASVGSSINHSSSIVGRRYNSVKGRCEFLIRNSELSCGQYPDHENNEELYDCENNHVWVPREVMRKGIGGAYSID